MDFITRWEETLKKYLLFLVPAMLLAAKGFADLWISAYAQPWIALTLLMMANVIALMILTLASAAIYLMKRSFWFPPGKLFVLITGMALYFDYSLGRTFGVTELAVPLTVWLLWGIVAYRVSREPERL